MKKINDLKKLVSDEQFIVLQHKLLLHRRHASIEFKILSLEKDQAVIRVSQDQSFAGNYADSKRLREIVHETFDDLLTPRKITARAVPFIPCEADIINRLYIQQLMNEYELKSRDLESDLGIHKTRISEWLSGKRELTKPVRNMFYWYFVAKGFIPARLERNWVEEKSA